MTFTAPAAGTVYLKHCLYSGTHMDRAPTINPDIAETPAGQEPRTVSLVTPVHEFADGFPAEHIYIGDEASDSAGEPKTVVRRLRIRNLPAPPQALD